MHDRRLGNSTDLRHTAHAEDFAGIIVDREEHTSHVRSQHLELLHRSIHCLQCTQPTWWQW